ncbi:hypothetical protein OH77DRAFT_1415878, partial [Trametes cingulata]
GSMVFFLQGGKTRISTVVDHETIEGLCFVIIKIDDGRGYHIHIKLPYVSYL